MANTRLFRRNVTFLLALPEYIADWTAPTSTELNAIWNASTGTQNGVHNITCALWEDGTEFSKDDSDTDDGLTFCQDASEVNPTFVNATVVFEALLDADNDATGEFNEARDLMMYPDIEYYAIQRIGKDSNQTFAAGDRISLVKVATDIPVWPIDGATDNARITQNFLFRGDLLWNYELAA